MQIPSRTEIANALFGTWMLVKMDRGGANWLDGSADGFWKSFFAAVLIAPFFALMLWLARYAEATEANMTAVWAIEAVSYVGAWMFWPVIAGALCQYLDPSMDARRYIVACNWSEIWILMLRMPLLLIAVSGLADQSLYALLSLAALIAVLFYRFQIARHTLPAPTGAAIGLAIADMMAGLLWRTGTDMAVLPYLGVLPSSG